MKKEKLFTPSNIFLCLALMVFVFSFAVVFTLNFRPLYYLDMDVLDIPTISGYAAEDVKANYDALISYNSIFYSGSLVFPTLPMSEPGRIHFEEVKDIFVIVQVLLMASFPLSAAGIFLKLRNKKSAFLKLTGTGLIIFPVVLGLLVAINWSSFFVTFHKLFFSNDYWIFDEVTDPVIRILPDMFFMHCAIMILALVLLGSLLCFIFYLLARRRKAAIK